MKCYVCKSEDVSDAGYFDGGAPNYFGFTLNVCSECGAVHKLDCDTRETVVISHRNNTKCFDYGNNVLWEGGK